MYLHLDLNSCFASVEQQANPLLRGKPVVVAAYTTSRGCILAASREAKLRGVKTGMRVQEGQKLCPNLLILPSDPDKYRFVNQKLTHLLGEYTDEVEVKSIDEMVLHILDSQCSLSAVAKEIKQRIKNEIGEWLTVSVGIAPNRYLAKVASELHKPDGLDVITEENVEETLEKLKLEDLCGIKQGLSRRLRQAGIFTPLAFYRATPENLRRALSSITGIYWWQRLHGFSNKLDERSSIQQSFGQSYALHQPFLPADSRLWQILYRLVAKMARRLRSANFSAAGVHLGCLFNDGTFWHHGFSQNYHLYAEEDFYTLYRQLLNQTPIKSVSLLMINCFNLKPSSAWQQSWLPEEQRKQNLTRAKDRITNRFGESAIFSGRLLNMETKILDRIAFGK